MVRSYILSCSAGTDTSNDYYAVSVYQHKNIILSTEVVFYPCGPSGFLTDTIRYLKTMGVNDEMIKTEQFGPLAEDSDD